MNFICIIYFNLFFDINISCFIIFLIFNQIKILFFYFIIGNNYESIFPNDPSKIPDNVSHTLLYYFMEMGSSSFSRSFHQSYFQKSLSDGKLVKRIWLSYSPILDNIYCTTCKLFGSSKIKKINLWQMAQMIGKT